jgi:hypothetical protein
VAQQSVDDDKQSFFMHILTTLVARGTSAHYQLFFDHILAFEFPWFIEGWHAIFESPKL